jgi:hypothetical protein
MITNSVKKAARIYYTTAPKNEGLFPSEVIDRAELKFQDIFENPATVKHLIESGCFKRDEDGNVVITETGWKIAEEEVNASKSYLENQKNNRVRTDRPAFKKEKVENLLHETIKKDAAVLIPQAIYTLQKLHAMDEVDHAKGTGKPGNRVEKVIRAFMESGENTILPKAKDKNGNPITERTGRCFGQEYTEDSVGQVLIKILQDKNMVNDCCKFEQTETE